MEIYRSSVYRRKDVLCSELSFSPAYLPSHKYIQVGLTIEVQAIYTLLVISSLKYLAGSVLSMRF